MNSQDNLARWHAVMEGGSKPDDLSAILADDCVFHSPVVHTPQKGKHKVMGYLIAAGATFSNTGFHYVREIVDGPHMMLEFTADLDGVFLNGVDIITFNEDGLITDFKVMVRPLKAVNKIWEMMAGNLEKLSAPTA